MLACALIFLVRAHGKKTLLECEHRQLLDDQVHYVSQTRRALAMMLLSAWSPANSWRTKDADAPLLFLLRPRRAILGLGLLSAAASSECTAYESIPPPEAGMAREKQDAQARKDKDEIEPYLAKFNTLDTEADFLAACDSMSLYLLGKENTFFTTGGGSINILAVRKAIRDSFIKFPEKAYKCSATRSGECTTRGDAIESAYASTMRILEKQAKNEFMW